MSDKQTRLAHLKIVLLVPCNLGLFFFYPGCYSFRTREEKDEWLEALFRTIKELYQRKSSLRVWNNSPAVANGDPSASAATADFPPSVPGGDLLGRVPPRLLRTESASKCMAECGQPFSMMRKRHNCRACGIVRKKKPRHLT